MNVLEGGSGRPVVMLHGFPDLSRTWRFQLPALIANGFRVLAPDLRGYGKTDRPEPVDAYKTERLVEDVLALLDARGVEQALLVGHDWGAVVAWHFAMHHPERVERLVIINGPHPVHYQWMLRTVGQLLRSWYAGFFQLPWLPEKILGARNAAIPLKLLESQAPAAFSDEDRAAHREALTRPGALSAMLHYYRAAARELRKPTKSPPVRVETPTLVIWGRRDPALSPELAQVPDSLASDLRIHHLPDAAHFPHLERPDEVNRVLLEFLHERQRSIAT